MTGPLTRLEPMPTATAAPLVLGIESSCDETGVGVVRGTALLAHEVASSVEEHVRFGGVIPELSLIHISEPTRRHHVSRMPSSA